MREPDDLWQPVRAVAVDQIPLHLRGPELRSLAGDPDVTHQSELESAGERIAVDRGNHRLGRRRAEVPPIGRPRTPFLKWMSLDRVHRLEVGTG